MSDVTVDSAAGLAAAIKSAHSGDVISLAAGNYGDLLIKSVNVSNLTIESLNSNSPATMNSISVLNSSGIDFEGLDVQYKPTAATVTYSSAVKISGSSDVTFAHGEITGGNAITGVPLNATVLDLTGNVIGLPTARGVTVDTGSSNVTIDHTEISQFFKGVVLEDATNLKVTNDNIHDFRTSAIVGSNISNVLINADQMSSAHPWQWDETGDHGDFIHIWTVAASQIAPSANITITNNNINQGDGTAILGININNYLSGPGFVGLTIADNTILNGEHQGIRLEGVINSSVVNNTLLQTSGIAQEAPGIYSTDNTSNTDISGNLTAYVKDVTNTDAASIHNNTTVQDTNAAASGYYTSALVDELSHTSNTATAYSDAVGSISHSAVTAAPAVSVANIVTQISSNSGVMSTATSNANQVMTGGNGNDTLVGLNGNDVLNGGAGDDYLNPGGGNNTETGGSGADKFVFGSDYISKGGTDTITDFSHTQGDKINLHAIDANTKLAGDQDFHFIGTAAFSHTAGELHYTVSGADAYVSGDVNGDGVADFTIHLVNVQSLMSSDFIL